MKPKSGVSTTTVYGQQEVLYLREPSDATTISINDIHQGQLGDCFLLSSFGEIALNNPTFIQSMIHQNANGTDTVRLYTGANGHPPTWSDTTFTAHYVTVNTVFPSNTVNNGATQDVVGSQKEIWPQVLEKAAASLGGSYSSIANGGWPNLAMEELTGKPATLTNTPALSLATLKGDMAAHDLIAFDTGAAPGLPFGLVSNHCYMLEGTSTVNGQTMLKCGNPWGFNQPAQIPFSAIASAFSQVAVGHT